MRMKKILPENIFGRDARRSGCVTLVLLKN